MKRLAILTRGGARRLFAAAPAAGAALGVALAASSAPRPDIDRTAEAVARITQGDLGPAGLARLQATLDPSQAALAARFDPSGPPQPQQLGLTPGWDSLSISGKPLPNPGPGGLEARRINATIASDASALRPARPFAFTPRTAEDRRRALRCLTQAIYYEAALESTEGQEAVAQVILNRVRDPNYANTVCGVVFEGAERSTGCQFSFTCDGSLSQPPVAWAWNRARGVAERALAGHVATEVGTATHYHADYVNPWWRPSLTKINQIGTHIFYRWKGWAGETRAFSQRYAGVEPVIDEARFSRPRLLRASADTPAAPSGDMAVGQLRTVEVEGQTRVVGAASLGGRRPPTPDEIAAINRRLAEFEAPRATPAPAATPPD
ncbi:MAG: cell wall hydrolase, partial [Brevundimonas sp.]